MFKLKENLQGEWDLLESRRKKLTSDLKHFRETVLELEVNINAIEERQVKISEQTNKSIP